ncbi:MAG: ATP-binding protein [Odoribacter sp.]|nr:ATP-binding protein [Odoribacter sp.]
MKYPVGIQTFEKIVKDGFVYVDKTDLIYSLVKEGQIYFLSRPRRFGKSLLLSTLRAYFEGKKELFAGLKIDALEQDWHVHRVFHFDFNGINFTESGALNRVLDSMLSEWEREYGIVTDVPQEYGLRFNRILQVAAEQTGRGAVVLVDEYDKPLLDVLERDPELLDRNRDILKAFYSVFKQADASLRFVFLTGVTKFSQVSVFSGFNQPKDISMFDKYEALCGITEEELYTQFAEPIREMAESDGCSEEEIRLRLKRHYDGYHFSKNMADIYNPFSLLNAFDSKDIRDYWFTSGTPSYLIRLMNHFHEGIDELTNKYYLPDEFINYKADVEYPLPMIYQSGYLTIKDYDKDSNLFLLDFPNNEVKSGFLAMVTTNYLQCRMPLESWMVKAVFALKRGQLEEFRKMLTSFLAGIPYSMRRKDNEPERERYFHYTFYLLLRLMSVYTVLVEKEQSEGRVDCIVETPQYVYIFEFKLDGTAADALRQIEEKGYARPYESDARQLYKVGVNFSSKTGTVEGWECRRR